MGGIGVWKFYKVKCLFPRMCDAPGNVGRSFLERHGGQKDRKVIVVVIICALKRPCFHVGCKKNKKQSAGCWYWDIPNEICQYVGFCCPGSLCLPVISSNSVAKLGVTLFSHLSWRISIVYAIRETREMEICLMNIWENLRTQILRLVTHPKVDWQKVHVPIDSWMRSTLQKEQSWIATENDRTCAEGVV